MAVKEIVTCDCCGKQSHELKGIAFYRNLKIFFINVDLCDICKQELEENINSFCKSKNKKTTLFKKVIKL